MVHEVYIGSFWNHNDGTCSIGGVARSRDILIRLFKEHIEKETGEFFPECLIDGGYFGLSYHHNNHHFHWFVTVEEVK